MNWHNYEATYKMPLGTPASVRAANRRRFIRATSINDARWRLARKFIMPEAATLISIRRCD